MLWPGNPVEPADHASTPAGAPVANQIDHASSANYSDLARREGLQTELERLEAGEDWRERADSRSPPEEESQPSERSTSRLLFADLIGNIIIGAAIIILIVIVALVVRYGMGVRVSMQAEADAGEIDSTPPPVTGALVNEPVASVREILAMDDFSAALGALQRLVLMAAAEATGSFLKRSDTAREALRRLPNDWPHYDTVAALVHAAERVRFAGDTIDREQLTAFVEAARPILALRKEAA